MQTHGVTYTDEEYLPLSGLQHFLFCRRQWALIHIEGLWAENALTVSGTLLHERAHDDMQTEKRGDTICTRGMNISSRHMGVTGKCDVLEFHRDAHGIDLFGWEGRWMPFPVEYKRGEPKENDCDRAQLCAQAMCLEEMLCCQIQDGALFYGETKRREPVAFDLALRQTVLNSVAEMHELFRRGHTPRVKRKKACGSCSLKELCLPALLSGRSASAYMEENL